MRAGFTTSITILRPKVEEDEFASEALDWTDPEEVAVDFMVSVQPMSSSEGPADRPQVISGWQLISPPGRDLPLRSIDRIRIPSGMVFAVIGDILRFPHPMKPNGVHHVEAILERVSG